MNPIFFPLLECMCAWWISTRRQTCHVSVVELVSQKPKGGGATGKANAAHGERQEAAQGRKRLGILRTEEGMEFRLGNLLNPIPST